MKKYLVTAMANNIVADYTIYAKSESDVASHIGEGVMLLNVKSHPVKDSFLKYVLIAYLIILIAILCVDIDEPSDEPMNHEPYFTTGFYN